LISTVILNAGSATGVNRSGEIFWTMVLANLAYAALVMFAIGNRISLSIGQGTVIGAIVGLLLWATADLVIYSTTSRRY